MIGVPIWFRLAGIGSVIVIVAALGWRVSVLQQQKAALLSWQDSIVQTTSVAFGTPDKKGVYPTLATGAVVPTIRAAGHAIVDLKASIAKANAEIEATAADGAMRRAASRDAAVAYDRAKPARHFTPAPVSADTDATEALELGRASWAELH